MADEADLTDIREQIGLDQTIRKIAAASQSLNINGSGECLVCGKVVEPGMYNGNLVTSRWCSNKCRDKK